MLRNVYVWKTIYTSYATTDSEYKKLSKTKLEWYRSSRVSGRYPLTFNFIFFRQDKYVQCSYCGKFVNYRKITRDHVWPKSLGGQIKTPACLSCNVTKEDRKPIEWAAYATQIGIAFSRDGNLYVEE